jgi:hypothetical protein
MLWIMNNWEKSCCKKAANTIKELVSIFFDFVRYFIADTCFLDGGILGTVQAHRHISRRASGSCDGCLAVDSH